MTFVIESSSLIIAIPIFRNLRPMRQPKGPDRVFLSIWDSGTGRWGRVFCQVISQSVGLDDMRVIGMQSYFFLLRAAPWFLFLFPWTLNS